MRALFAFVVASALAMPIAGHADQAANCAVFARMTDDAVNYRKSNLYTEAQAVTRIQQDYADKGAKFTNLMPQIAEWIWTLPQDQLGPEVGQAMKAQCMGG